MQEPVKQKSRGRPKGAAHPRFVGLRLPTEQMTAVDAWRATSPEPISRSEAIRRLIEAGLLVEADKPLLPLGSNAEASK